MQMTVISHHQSAAVIHPAKAPLDFPALTLACAGSDGSSALALLAFASLEGRNGGLDATTAQLTSKVGIVIGFVRDQLLGTGLGSPAFLPDRNRLEIRFSQHEFMRLSAVHMQANGQAMPSTTAITFEPLPTLVLPTSSPWLAA